MRIDCDAAAIELVDRTILNLARVSPLHSHLVSVLSGDPGALLWVEFYGDSPAEARGAAHALEERWRRGSHGYAVVRAATPADLKRFRELRKAGLGLLSAAGQGNERSVAFVEDTAVDPRSLREYTAQFARILRSTRPCARDSTVMRRQAACTSGRSWTSGVPAKWRRCARSPKKLRRSCRSSAA